MASNVRDQDESDDDPCRLVICEDKDSIHSGMIKKTFIFDIQTNSDEYILLIEESLKEPPIICEDEGSIHIGILIKISLIDNETN